MPANVKIFGVGNAGISVMERLVPSLAGATFVAVDTDAGSVSASSATAKLHLENKQLRGLGSGGDPERAETAAEESSPQIKALCDGAQVVFVLAGLGGGSGTGIAPFISKVAREAGALVVAFVTLPFDCEGRHKQALAREGMEQLQDAADAVICLPNQKAFKLMDENTSVRDTFRITNDLLAEGVRGVWRLIAHKGLIEVQLADFCALLRDRHFESLFATAEASGQTRSRDALEKLLAHPVLDGGDLITESAAVLVSLISGPSLTMAEVNRIMEQIQRHCEHTQVLMGAAVDDSFGDNLAITLVAAKKVKTPESRAEESEQLDKQLMSRIGKTRSATRFVPPPPPLAPEKLEQMFKNQPGVRGRKKQIKMLQGQLPLEIVSKGRFEKSEPTIHQGEDLDVPTYIRRGISLN